MTTERQIRVGKVAWIIVALGAITIAIVSWMTTPDDTRLSESIRAAERALDPTKPLLRFRIVIIEGGREVEMMAAKIWRHGGMIQLEDVVRDGQEYKTVFVVSGRVYVTEIER